MVSEKAIKKFNLTWQKSREVSTRLNTSVEDQRNKNEDRFQLKDEGLKRVQEEREEFL